jgi:hypothetical protein
VGQGADRRICDQALRPDHRLIRCGEAERIATGEYLALVMDCTGQDALQWQEKGAPVGQMMPLDAAQLRYYYFAILRTRNIPTRPSSTPYSR